MMKVKTLKHITMKNRILGLKLWKILPFWQEMVLIIVSGIVLSDIIINIPASFRHTTNIIYFCIFLSILLCLVGQFYWKNLILGMISSVPLTLVIVMIFAALSDLYKQIYKLKI